MVIELAAPGLLVRVRTHGSHVTNKINDGHDRTAYVYQHFINLYPGSGPERLAGKRMGYHPAEIAVNCIGKDNALQRQFANVDSLKHLVSAIRRDPGSRYKK